MRPVSSKNDPEWLILAKESLRDAGYCLISDLLSTEDITTCRQALIQACTDYVKDVGEEKIGLAKKRGDVDFRALFLYHPTFLKLLEHPVLLHIVDELLSPHAVLRLQNGFISETASTSCSTVVQCSFHVNGQFATGGRRTSLDMLLALSDFDGRGGLVVVPGSHLRVEPPPGNYMYWAQEPLVCPAGALLVFDSALWHRDRPSVTEEPLLYLGLQFVRPFMKQHIDFVRALGENNVRSLSERTRTLLGWDSRVPGSMQEFYVPPEERLYKPGQK